MSDIIEIKSGELYIYGSHIPRHEEKPWLFSASAVHKALEEVIRKKARIKKKDEDTYFHNVRPALWFRNNLKVDGYVEKIVYRTRVRILKYGTSVGFGLHCDSRITMTEAQLDRLGDHELVYSGIRGNGKKSGTYLCQQAVVDYTASIDPDFRHELVDLFVQVVNGNVEEVVETVKEAEKKAKGTPERAEDKTITNRAYAQMHNHGVNPRPVLGEVTRGVFGKSKKEVMEEKGIPEPFNDNLPLDDLFMLTNGRVELTRQLSIRVPGTVDTKEAKRIGYAAGVFARLLATNSDKIRAVSDKIAAKEEAARKAAALKAKRDAGAKAKKAAKKKRSED